MLNPSGEWSYFAASQHGRLLYGAGSRTPPKYDAVWLSRRGQVTSIDPDWTFDPGDNNRALALSPDGRRLAVTVLEESNYDIWVKELPRSPASRLTFDELRDVRPRWIPNGQSVRTCRSKGDAPVGRRTYGTGTVVAMALDRFLAGGRDFRVVIEPGPKAAVQGAAPTRDYLLVNVLENVRGRLYKYWLVGDRWVGEPVDVPDLGR